MKKLLFILIVILILNIFNSYSQDLINPPKLPLIEYIDSLIVNYDSTFDNYKHYVGINKNFCDNHFILGWNWGGIGARLDEALNINFHHGYDFNNPNYKSYMRVAEQMNGYRDGLGVTGGRNTNNVFNAQCIYLEPTLIVDSTENFKGRFGDSTGAVFGFKYTFKTSVNMVYLYFGDIIY